MTPASARKAARAALGKRKADIAVEQTSWDRKALCVTITLPDGRGHTWSGPSEIKGGPKAITKHFADWLAKLD